MPFSFADFGTRRTKYASRPEIGEFSAKSVKPFKAVTFEKNQKMLDFSVKVCYITSDGYPSE